MAVILSRKRCIDLVEDLGMSVEYGLGFTVCCGQFINGEKAPEWIAELNGSCIYEIAEEILRRNKLEEQLKQGGPAPTR